MAKILVVDDEVKVCDTLKKHLEERGHDLVSAGDGVEALEKVEGEKFDLIISDWIMPRMIGSELCKTLKQRESTQDIPVILIGVKQRGLKLDHWETEAYDAGACDYLDKPFKLTDLEASVSKALA